LNKELPVHKKAKQNTLILQSRVLLFAAGLSANLANSRK